MDAKAREIATQVAFKGAIEMERGECDLTDPAGVARFQETFDVLRNVLIESMAADQDPDERMAQIIQGEFPGTQVVHQQPPPQVSAGVRAATGPTATTPVRPATAAAVRAPAPAPAAVRHAGWSSAMAGDGQGQPVRRPAGMVPGTSSARDRVTEVWDNRAQLRENPKRPWFKSTTGGDKAPAYWPPSR